METRQLGKDGPSLTAIGLGTWAIGGPWMYGLGPSDDGESVAAIHRALDLGVGWIDTAPSYGLGHAEELVGRALQGRRERVFVATKCGMVWDDRQNVRIHAGARSIRAEIEQSLARLGTDHVDLYQIHWPDPETPVEESWSEMAKLREEGKVRHIGVSNFGVDLLDRCEKIAHVEAAQTLYNMLERDAERDVLPWCEAYGTGVLAYSPMQSGLLTGAFDPKKLARDDARRRSAKLSAPRLAAAARLCEALRPMARKHGKTVGQLAVAWVLARPGVTSAIVGARRAAQAAENVGGAGWSLAPADLAAVRRILP
jgi:aryl-alcohol dehydrogenase-like predicted oxidoreductase